MSTMGIQVRRMNTAKSLLVFPISVIKIIIEKIN